MRLEVHASEDNRCDIKNVLVNEMVTTKEAHLRQFHSHEDPGCEKGDDNKGKANRDEKHAIQSCRRTCRLVEDDKAQRA